MANADQLRCVIIGEGALPIICSEILEERGHAIVALVSPDERALLWARSRGIAHGTGPSELVALIDDEPFDYLLSITNFQKLPDPVLKAARRNAINYHDAPLPRYAGSHATSWALLNGETSHAVTWHLLSSRVDAGDILRQALVEIEPDDTALTLNVKCFDAAVDSFRTLLDDMEADVIDPRPQDRAERSFYRRSQRPPAACTLRFDAPAEQIQALSRALDFGPFPNPLGLPKIALGESFAIVTALELLDRRSGELPGVVAAITADRLIVTTASADVAVGGFLTIDGMPMSVAEAVECGDLRIGGRVVPMEEERAARLTALCADLAEHEAFWMAQLAQARATSLPHVLRPIAPPRRTASRAVVVVVQVEALANAGGGHAGDRLLVTFLVYFAWLSGVGIVEVAFSYPQLLAEVGELYSIVSTCLPLRISGGLDRSFRQLAQHCEVQIQELRARRSYVRDAPVRDPATRSRLAAVNPAAWPICFELVERVDIEPTGRLPPGRMLTVRLATEGNACTLLYDPDVLDSGQVERMARELQVFLGTLPNCSDAPLRTLPPPGRHGERMDGAPPG